MNAKDKTENSEELRNRAMIEGVKCLYVPYIWGGNDPVLDGGLDCSGFLGYVFRKIGLLPSGFDDTAQGYYSRWPVVKKPYKGCVAFYGKHAAHITHCMLVVNSGVCMGAVRGNSWMTTVERARLRDARIDIRSIDYRKDLCLITDPFKEVSSGTNSNVR